MKRFFFLLSAIVVSLTMAAQMQVWSNGTIIFSHDQTDVDSISFGSPMQVQTNMNNTSIISLAGSVYVSSLSGSDSNNNLYALFFLDESHAYLGYNSHGTPYSSSNWLDEFMYTINGNDINLTRGEKTINGKIIGKNGLVFSNFQQITYSDNSGTYTDVDPAVFITLNR